MMKKAIVCTFVRVFRVAFGKSIELFVFISNKFFALIVLANPKIGLPLIFIIETYKTQFSATSGGRNTSSETATTRHPFPLDNSHQEFCERVPTVLWGVCLICLSVLLFRCFFLP